MARFIFIFIFVLFLLHIETHDTQGTPKIHKNYDFQIKLKNKCKQT